MIDGSCHCGAVEFAYPGEPEWLTDCNCSICRRLSTLWAYANADQITLRAADNATLAYAHGDRTLALHTCRTCGCTTHWVSLGGDAPPKMAVNFRLCDPEVVANIRIRKFDGRDTWQYLDDE